MRLPLIIAAALLAAQPVLAAQITKAKVDEKVELALHSFGASMSAKECKKETDLYDLIYLKILLDTAQRDFGIPLDKASTAYDEGRKMVRELNSYGKGQCLDPGLWIRGWLEALTDAHKLRTELQAQR